MKNLLFVCSLFLFSFSACQGQPLNNDPAFKSSPDFKIQKASAKYNADLEQIVFEIQVEGVAGNSVPKGVGQLDGAPVLGYVFPTTLKSTDVGFSEAEGIVALALTSHPDFDDTPLWDKNNDQRYDNDGVIWHPHWVVLNPDDRVPGGLAVKQFDKTKDKVTLPPTNPGMPMYMDSPGFPVITKGNSIRVVVPAYRMNHQTDFSFDGVAAYMQVNGSDQKRPMLGVYEVYSVASGDLSLPFRVEK